MPLLILDASSSAVATRTGVPRPVGRLITDDAGLFYPLGGTLFWSVDGWRNDRARLQQNVAFLGTTHHYDYQRILGDVGWPGQQIDSTAPDYEQILGDVIDDAYSRGVRTQVTVWGGSDRDPINAAKRVANVVRPRRDKVLALEAANESMKNGPDERTLDAMVTILAAVHPLVAASAPLGQFDWNTWIGDRIAHGATLGTVHYDRSEGDEDWRFVRQPWDSRAWAYCTSNNEPKGPNSSVSETKSIPRLVLHRAVGLLCGVSAFVLHNGSGVTGRAQPWLNRPANLWEVPGIDPLMIALRRIDAVLPNDLATWPKTTQHGSSPVGPHPLTADAIWSDAKEAVELLPAPALDAYAAAHHHRPRFDFEDLEAYRRYLIEATPYGAHGVSRCYAAVRGGRFVTLVLGVKGYTDLRALSRCTIDIIDVETAARTTATIAAGQSYRLTSSHGGSDAGYLILGENQ